MYVKPGQGQNRAFGGRGEAAFPPAMMLALLFYGYAMGEFSSRRIERATYDSVAFRFIAANTHTDHDTIAAFRKRFLSQLKGLFVQILQLARALKLLKVGNVSLDGTKVRANASKHRALSYGHAKRIEAQLQAEVEQLLRMAEQADRQDRPDGMDIPAEIARREARLAAIREAKAQIEARAQERLEAEKKVYEEKVAAREAREKKTGKRFGGKPPKPPAGGVGDREQVNLTDEQSRIMKAADGGFEQAYNAQAPCLPLGRRNRQGMARKMILLREGNGARSTIPAHRADNGARLPEKKPAGVRCDSLLCRIIPASQPYRLWHTTFRVACRPCATCSRARSMAPLSLAGSSTFSP